MMDIYNRAWIIEKSKEVISTYAEGITLRQLYYRLVAQGMTNNIQHYKRVVTAMVKARWTYEVEMEAFVDRERTVFGETKAEEVDVEDSIDEAKKQIDLWMRAYHLDKWSNQEYFVEVWIEKKALQGVFEKPCDRFSVALAPCKGYPSLTFLNEAKERFEKAECDGKKNVILYFGDYDPSGEDIPRSLKENISRMGCDIEVDCRALNAEQIAEMKLPGVPPKRTDSRTANWGGKGAVELDAVEPHKLQEICVDAIEEYFDKELYAELLEKEKKEREEYIEALKEFVKKK